MKPTKSRVFCKDSGKNKVLFESEKKAGLFIKFNSEEIAAESGYSPIRSYFCISCGGWHVTSRNEVADSIAIKSRTEKILETYIEEKNKKELAKAQKAIIRKNLLERIDNTIKNIESIQTGGGEMNECIGLIDSVLDDLEHAKKLTVKKSEIKKIKDRLDILNHAMKATMKQE